jgi:hypothetical protein
MHEGDVTGKPASSPPASGRCEESQVSRDLLELIVVDAGWSDRLPMAWLGNERF